MKPVIALAIAVGFGFALSSAQSDCCKTGEACCQVEDTACCTMKK